MTVEAVLQKKSEHPDALFICHPESAPEVTALSDYACSTSAMYDYCRTNPAKKFIIGTEAGILFKLRVENPDKEFILASPALFCPNMKLTSLEDVLYALQTLSPVITVSETVRIKAKAALDRMLAVPRD
jgi:quinolinate synthase